MNNEMSKVLGCNASGCSYNMKDKCHALGITIGGGDCPECDTSMMDKKKAGCKDVSTGVGACKVEACKYNDCLECTAEEIRVKMHGAHAECGTVKFK
ncbi:MAG: DUF1540 domain-containing protein [bacterium]|nr:DUF1540 domain-containing protein [bacterium]